MNSPVAEVAWGLTHHQGYNALCTLYCTDGLLLDDVYGEKKLPSAQHAQHLYSLARGAWVRTFERHELK